MGKIEREKEQSKDKQMRIQNFEEIMTEMKAEGYEAKEGIISVVKANVMALILTSPIICILIVIFAVLNMHRVLRGGVLDVGLFLLVLLPSIIIHELLHGVGWSWFCKKRWKSIGFGVIWKYLTPYCHCKEVLKSGEYLFGGLLPFMVLGLGIFLIAVITGNVSILYISLFNVLAAGGDVTIALMLRKYKKALIIDHPTECGFVAFIKINES